MIYIIIFCAVTIVALYIVAAFCNKDDRGDDDILFVSRRQWKAILKITIPLWIAIAAEIAIMLGRK